VAIVSVADFGSSDGANSVGQLRAAVHGIRSTQVQIHCIIHACMHACMHHFLLSLGPT
jgi:hypothetical protein